jgi:hypothetical protein
MIASRTVELAMKSGQVASVDVSSQLVERVREAFNLKDAESVTDVHIKYYLIAAMKNAAGDTDD